MDERETTVSAAMQAGEIIRAAWADTGTRVYEKGSAINPVTEVDRACEQRITAHLHAAFPTYGILTEESPGLAGSPGDRWIVDPLDGTSNFIRRYPFVAVSIALELKGQLTLGVVYNPILDELYIGVRGNGATLNGNSLRCSTTGDPQASLLASGFPYDAWDNPDNNTAEWARFIRRTRSLRCDGSSALDLCHVASGRLDGYWEKGIYAWDMAAGILIAREAGCLVTDYAGGSDCLQLGQVVAANPALHAWMLEMLHSQR